MSRTCVAVVGALGVLSWGWAADEKASSAKVDLKKMKATVERLESPLTLEFVETPLADAVKFFEDWSKIKFHSEAEPLPEMTLVIHVDSEPFGVGIQKVLDQCNWTYAVRPDGDILLRPVPPTKKK